MCIEHYAEMHLKKKKLRTWQLANHFSDTIQRWNLFHVFIQIKVFQSSILKLRGYEARICDIKLHISILASPFLSFVL